MDLRVLGSAAESTSSLCSPPAVSPSDFQRPFRSISSANFAALGAARRDAFGLRFAGVEARGSITAVNEPCILAPDHVPSCRQRGPAQSATVLDGVQTLIEIVISTRIGAAKGRTSRPRGRLAGPRLATVPPGSWPAAEVMDGRTDAAGGGGGWGRGGGRGQGGGPALREHHVALGVVVVKTQRVAAAE